MLRIWVSSTHACNSCIVGREFGTPKTVSGPRKPDSRTENANTPLNVLRTTKVPSPAIHRSPPLRCGKCISARLRGSHQVAPFCFCRGRPQPATCTSSRAAHAGAQAPSTKRVDGIACLLPSFAGADWAHRACGHHQRGHPGCAPGIYVCLPQASATPPGSATQHQFWSSAANNHDEGGTAADRR